MRRFIVVALAVITSVTAAQQAPLSTTDLRLRRSGVPASAPNAFRYESGMLRSFSAAGVETASWDAETGIITGTTGGGVSADDITAGTLGTDVVVQDGSLSANIPRLDAASLSFDGALYAPHFESTSSIVANGSVIGDVGVFTGGLSGAGGKTVAYEDDLLSIGGTTADTYQVNSDADNPFSVIGFYGGLNTLQHEAGPGYSMFTFDGSVTGDSFYGSFFNGTHTGSGSGLTNLNASNLASGTVPVARLPASIAYTDDNVSFDGTMYVDGTIETESGFIGDGSGLTGVGVTSTNVTGDFPISRITNLQASLNAKAPLASPTFTGIVTAPGIIGSLDIGNSGSRAVHNGGTAVMYWAGGSWHFTDVGQPDTIVADGSLLTNVSVAAGNVTAGTLPASVQVPAGNVASGTLPDARLSGNVVKYNDSSPLVFNAGELHLGGNGNWVANGGITVYDLNSVDTYRLSFNGSQYRWEFDRGANVYTAGNFIGGGSQLTSLNANSLASGTVPDARIASNIPRISTTGNSIWNFTSGDFYLRRNGSDRLFVHTNSVELNANTPGGVFLKLDAVENIGLRSTGITMKDPSGFTRLTVDNHGVMLAGAAFPPSIYSTAGTHVLNNQASFVSLQSDVAHTVQLPPNAVAGKCIYVYNRNPMGTAPTATTTDGSLFVQKPPGTSYTTSIALSSEEGVMTMFYRESSTRWIVFTLN